MTEALFGPVHSGTLEALGDDGLAGSLDDPGADEVAVVTEIAVAHAVTVLLEVVEGFLSDLSLVRRKRSAGFVENASSCPRSSCFTQRRRRLRPDGV